MIRSQLERFPLPLGELLFLLILFIFSLFIFVNSFDFPGSVGRFPRVVSVILLAMILYVAGKELYTSSALSESETSSRSGMGRDGVILTFLIGLYYVLAYLVGFLISSLVFTAAYLYIYNIGIKKTVYTLVAVLIINYLFATFVQIRIDEGLIFGGF